MKKPARKRVFKGRVALPGKAASWAAGKAKEKAELHRQTLASGGFKERLEALYGIRKDAK